ncbi:MAG: Enzyme that catalyzes the fourth step in the histidine pathway [Alyxoria varia]|nr:MAG: Enzyme that catalyzes the fourth step in the histidine pathway [Alyxoria varia]
MTVFRPCIDLHSGQVKQIVGGSLSENVSSLKTNFVSTRSAGFYATLYRDRKLKGGHVIMLGPGNEEAAKEAVKAWPGSLQVGGGINAQNAAHWIDHGAEKVIVTSYLFRDNVFSQARLDQCLEALGNDRQKLVIDLSCRRRGGSWFVATNKWQTFTDFEITKNNLQALESYCSEFLVHAADNEGLQRGIDEELVSKLAECCSIPITYAGGARDLNDLDKVKSLSNGKVDVTIGSALDIFGGTSVAFEDCVAWNARNLRIL